MYNMTIRQCAASGIRSRVQHDQYSVTDFGPSVTLQPFPSTVPRERALGRLYSEAVLYGKLRLT
jgi:hypothetical protein